MKTNLKESKTNSEFDINDIIGCKAVAGESITDIAKEYKVDRNFVYRQKSRVQNALIEHKNTPKEQTIIITKELVKRIIIGCMLLCKGSTEDCRRFLALVFSINISIGKISGIINKAAENARVWNESILLDKIYIGANDEIFQGNRPILVGVDPKTTYIYLFHAASNREANTWGCALLDKVETQGLWLTQAVSDAGKGIIKGTKDVFGENIIYQADVFHVIYEFNKGIKSLENYTYRCIKEHERLLKKSSRNNTFNEQIEKAKNKEFTTIQAYDQLYILSIWIRELLEIGGYFYEDRVILFRFIIQQIEELKLATNNYLKKSIKFIKNNLEKILQFVKIAEDALSNLAVIEGVDEEILRKMWIQEIYRTNSPEYNYLESEIGIALGSRYLEIRQRYAMFKSDITRASSIVECINSLIRPYINLKRSIPENFTHILQMYFNTRKYRRSRIAERREKSPYELLTGNKCDNILDILCPTT